MSVKFVPYLNQDFEKLKNQHLKSNQLFTDETFPAHNSSLYRFSQRNGQVTWKRPHEICNNPQFVVNKIEPDDLDQGQLGNCWLIASAASVLTVPEYYSRVIPENQDFEKGNYAGIFHFRFWNSGEWVDVCIDDKLPLDKNNRLVFCHNNVDKNEFFGPLLEKAYAKLNSCYEFLIGGNANMGFVDLTGGVNETFSLKRPKTEDFSTYLDPKVLWEMMFKSHKLKSLCSAAIDVNEKEQEHVENNGLVLGHAYGILNIIEIVYSNGSFSVLRTNFEASISAKTLKLIRIRNPWGVSDVKKSWNGQWSKDSSNWKQVSDGLINHLAAKNQEDGEFYISFEEFLEYFDTLDIVHVNLNAMYSSSKNNSDLKWNLKQWNGEWKTGKNSGGCGNGGDQKGYWTNPQYPITFTQINHNSELSVIISLMQTETVRKRIENNGKFENSFEDISFRIYSVKNEAELTQDFKYDPRMLTEVDKLPFYLASREVTKRFTLKAGKYVIIPSMFEKNLNMKFLLRVFYESLNESILSVNPTVNDKKLHSTNDEINKNLVSSVFKNEDIQNKNGQLKPMSPISNKSGSKIDSAKPIVPPINTDNDASRNETLIDLKDEYNKWFYGGLSPIQIFNLVKEAKLASAKLAFSL